MMKTKDHAPNAPTTLAATNDDDKIPTTSKNKSTRKGKPSKMQIAFTNAMKEHNTYMQESDKIMLAEMKEQAEKDRELRKEELGTFKDSMAFLASAIAGRAKPITQPAPVNQPHYYPIPLQHDITIDNQETYFKL
jgi:hypothetical protein